MILLTMGLNSEVFLDQPFKTQNRFQNDQISLSNSSPRRHTNFRLRAAAPQIVAKYRRRRRRLSAQGGKKVKQALNFSDKLRGSCGVFAVCMGKQCKSVFRHCDLGRAKSLSTRGSGQMLSLSEMLSISEMLRCHRNSSGSQLALSCKWTYVRPCRRWRWTAAGGGATSASWWRPAPRGWPVQAPRCRASHHFPDCLLIVSQCTRTHSRHPPPTPYMRSRGRGLS